MEKVNAFVEKVRDYFQQNPHQFGWVFVLVGVILLIGSIRNWGWIFEGDGRLFNIAWVSENFGHRTAQMLFIIFSVIMIITGLAWVYLFKK